jgi:diguanylate cyclase (GGDEF)-like protein
MDPAIVRITLSLIGPGILVVFGIAFASAWLIDRKRNYLLLLAGACMLFAMGAASQILHCPVDIGLNAMVSGALYTTAVLMAVEGVLLRSERSLGLGANIAIFVVFWGLLWYFFYVDRNLIARIYIQNFGYGIILLVAAYRLSGLAGGRLGDRILFWSLLAFGLHFFPRTILTIGFSEPIDPAVFENSVFWQALHLSLAVLGSGFALAILAASVADVIDDLRHERDIDHLTGILNRRGFEDAIATAVRRSGSVTASLILCDIDHFKSINDAHGHEVGDRVLQEIAKVLVRTKRKRDVVGRVGGEEFAIFLSDTDGTEAYECAERFRTAISEANFSHVVDRARITASFGIATATGGRWKHLYKSADNRLYEAKRSGRNRTVASSVSNFVSA